MCILGEGLVLGVYCKINRILERIMLLIWLILGNIIKLFVMIVSFNVFLFMMVVY